MKYIEGIDYWVRYREFPCTTIFAWAVSLGDGTFDVWLNTRVSEEKQMEGLRHDLKHLEDNHFYRDDLTLEQKEAIAWGAAGLVGTETKEMPAPIQLEPTPPPVKPAPKQEPAPAPPPPPPHTEITTVGQLLKFMVECDVKKRSGQQPRERRNRVSIDIYGD